MFVYNKKDILICLNEKYDIYLKYSLTQVYFLHS